MQSIKKRKFRVLSAMLTVVFGLTLAFGADASTKPTIGTIKTKTSSSITLPITYTTLKSKKVKVKIEVTNKKTNNKTTEVKKDKLGSDGKAKIKINDLTAGTDYSFRIKVKKDSSTGSYSSWSKAKTAKTDAE